MGIIDSNEGLASKGQRLADEIYTRDQLAQGYLEMEGQVVRAVNQAIATQFCKSSTWKDTESGVRSRGPQNTSPKVGRQKRERKRPRDKVLRDNVYGQNALDIRKRTAFLGYTYQRPRRITVTIEKEGERV